MLKIRMSLQQQLITIVFCISPFIVSLTYPAKLLFLISMKNTIILITSTITIATLGKITEALPKKPYYWTTRKLECESILGHRVSRCALRNSESKPELNPMCHEKIDEVKNETRIYCRIMCEESDDTTVLKKVPSWNHACNIYYSYMLERFREDWYLWRSGDCLNTTITFEIRCGFARDSRTFYRQNQKLFEYDDTEDEQKRARNWRIAFS